MSVKHSSSQGSRVYYAEEGVERFYELEAVDDLKKTVLQHNRADARMNTHIQCDSMYKILHKLKP